MRDKTRHQKDYRRPRTTQERRENGKRSKWGRAKRNQANLIDAWDDDGTTIQKTWKVKRRHQYRGEPRGKPHTLFLPNSPTGATWRFWIDIWALKEYFNDQDIPFCIEDKWHKEARVYTHEYVYVVNIDTWVLMPLKKPRTTYWCTLLGYKLTWWSNKDIGIEHILQTCSNARNIS